MVFHPYEFLDACGKELGPTFTVRLFGIPPLVLFSRPEDVKEVFTQAPMNGARFNQRLLKAFLGEYSVLIREGEDHLRARRLLLPPFHGDRMRHYGEQMLDIADREIDSWPVDQPFAMLHKMHGITISVMLRAIFGTNDPARERELAEIVKWWFEIADWGPLMLPFMRVDAGPWSPWGKFKRRTQKLDRELYREISDRRRDLEAGKHSEDVLTLLLQAVDEDKKPMSDPELRDELISLLIAGTDTSANALSWAFRFILGAPEIHQRLVSELAEVERTGLSAERVGKLPLLDATVREVLRLAPIFPLAGRILDAPAKVGQWALPEGVAVGACTYLTQRDPAVFSDPSSFNPDRFINEKFSPYEWFPFGGGIRRCVGASFAIYEMKMVLARVLLRVKLRLDPTGPMRSERHGAAISPSEGLRVRVTERPSESTRAAA
jgi:cytochrome P450